MSHVEPTTHRNLRRNLTILFLLLSITPLALVSWVSFVRFQESISNEVIENLSQIAKDKAAHIKNWLFERAADAKVVSESPIVVESIALLTDRNGSYISKKRAKELVEDYLRLIKTECGYYDEVFVLDNKGDFLATTEKPQDCKADRDYFRGAMRDQVTITDIRLSPYFDKPTMFVSAPVKNKKGEIMGVVVGRIKLDVINEIMRAIKLGETGESYLVNKEGYFITESKFEPGYTLKKKLSTKGVKECLAGRTGFGRYQDYRGGVVLGAYCWIPEHQWGLIVEQDIAEAYSGIYRLRKNILAIGLVAIVVITLITLKVCGRIVRKLEKTDKELAKRYEEIADMKDFMNNVLESMDDGVMTTDREGRITSFNKAAERITGFSTDEAIGMKCSDVLRSPVGDTYCPIKKVLETGRPTFDYEVNIFNKADQTVPVNAVNSPLKDTKGRIIGVLKVFRDVTQLRLIREQMIKSEKLAAVGQLSAGVAHEINNPLAIILGRAEYLLSEIDETDSKAKSLRVIEEETERVMATVSKLLSFSREETPEVKHININEVVTDALSLARHQMLVNEIKAVTELDPSLPKVLADRRQIQQVFINLILNAFQAMPEGGVLTISTAPVVEDESIEIKFADTGCGIPKENLGRIFDPFFTTKGVGEGTGLGLSVSHAIIEKHKGTIDVKSEVGKGSIFAVKLPIG